MRVTCMMCEKKAPAPLSGVGDLVSHLELLSACKISNLLVDLRSRTPLIKAAGSLDLQVTPSHTRTRSPTLRLGLPS